MGMGAPIAAVRRGGTAQRVSLSPAAEAAPPVDAEARGGVEGATMGMGAPIAAVGRGGTAQRVSLSPAAEAAPPVDADEARRGVEGDAVGISLHASRVGGTTEGVAQRALGPLPPRPVLRTAATVVALAARTGLAVCTDGCAGGTCRNGRAGTIVPAAILAATAPTAANPYLNASLWQRRAMRR